MLLLDKKKLFRKTKIEEPQINIWRKCSQNYIQQSGYDFLKMLKEVNIFKRTIKLSVRFHSIRVVRSVNYIFLKYSFIYKYVMK